MQQPRCLVCWIGNTDLWAMAGASDAHREAVQSALRKPPATAPGMGPVRTLVSQVEFDRVDLISNYPDRVNELFAAWLGNGPTIHSKALKNPSNHEEVFHATRDVLTALTPENRRLGRKLCFHLSPGTPTMAATLLLLGKTQFPATLYQTHDSTVSQAVVPFDIDIYLSEVLQEPDSVIQALATEAPSQVQGFEHIVGESQAIRQAVGRAKRAAVRGFNVLITGPSGSGKELFAQAIHNASPRRTRPYMAFNCAAVGAALFEAELFGVERRAATGVDERPGLFAAADGGTLFLDEVGECTLENQAKLLRALQPRRRTDPVCLRAVRPVGADTDRAVDVRIVAATNRHLRDLIDNQRFREDLYYRLATIVVRLPSLAERRSDIRLIADDYLGWINRELAGTEPAYRPRRLTDPAYRRLAEYDWPGNVRQLNNVLVQAAILSSGDTIGRREVDAAIAESASTEQGGRASLERGDGFSLDRKLTELERYFIEGALEEAGWPDQRGAQARAARLLGLNSQQDLGKRMQRLGIKTAD